MADTQSVMYILLSVFTTTVIASLLRVNSILLVYQQPRQPPEHRQLEPLMMEHQRVFLFFTSFYVLASIAVASTFFDLAFHGAGHWLPPFFASTTAVSMVGQVSLQFS
jgi:hypothetical protein